MVGPHFHHSHLVFTGEPEQRLGHPDVVVEVALRVEHVVFFGQHGGNEFFGGGLSVGARHADDLGAQRAAVVSGQLLQRVEAVVGQDIPAVALHGILRLVNHGIGAALLQGFGCKCVAVERFPFEGEEYGAFGAFSAVGGHRGVTGKDVVKFCNVHVNNRFVLFCVKICCEVTHYYSSMQENVAIFPQNLWSQNTTSLYP